MKENIEVEVVEREIALFEGMAEALWRIFRWCEDKGIHEFSRKDVKHLLRTESESARFGDWVWFGGLVYKRGKGRYGLNMERCDRFFRGRYQIPLRIFKKTYKMPKTWQYRTEGVGTINEIPALTRLIGSDGEFRARYRPVREEGPQTQPLFA